ncbi:hypothetical protein IPF86_02240 [Candidatus Nomurabacteria bacterium]|nr:MAG: hypothetical protein IPF86_02240 [Candidatus Nomurabacteria bacterium]
MEFIKWIVGKITSIDGCSYNAAKRAKNIKKLSKEKKVVDGTSTVIEEVSTTKYAIANN